MTIMEKILIGIDEAGRGPLAGPVSVGVFAVRSKSILKKFKGVKDSKQLTEAQREEWFTKIKMASKTTWSKETSDGAPHAFYAVSFSSAKIIDEKGIVYAIKSAMDRALKKIERQLSNSITDSEDCGNKEKTISNFDFSSVKVLLDGSLKAPERYINQKTIIDGDAKEPIIALASICAKVLRDRRMKKLSFIFSEYGFDIHKGYGTKAHYMAIKKHGLSSEHRKSFLTRLTQNS